MDFKKFISGVSAMAIAASAVAGLAVTASAALKETTYDFSTASPAAPTTSKWTAATATDPLDEANTAAKLTAANNSGNGTGAYVYYDLSTLIPADATSYTVSYKVYYPYTTASRVAVGLADLTNLTFARYGYSTETMIGSTGHFATEDYIRATAGGNRSFLTSWTDGNRWLTVTDTVDLVNNTYSSVVSGDSDYATSGELTDNIKNLNTLLVYGYSTNGTAQDLVYLDDITVSATYPTPGAATAIKLSFVADDTEVATQSIDISDQDLIGGDTASYYIPAYVEGDNGNLYKTTPDATNYYAKSSAVATGETTVEIPVTLATDKVHQYAEFDGVGTGLGRDNRYSNGSLGNLSTDGTPAITVAQDGKYTITIVVGATEGTARTGSAFVQSGEEKTELGSVGFNGYPNTITFSDISLKSGDVINVVAGRGSTSKLDYVIIEKTGEIETPKTLPDVTVEQVAESTSFDADNAARAYTGTFTVTADNYAVSGVEWTASIGSVEGTATSTFETKISADENSEVGVTVVTGLIIQLDKAESFEGVDVTATAIAAE
jgi:hypothetical protein